MIREDDWNGLMVGESVDEKTTLIVLGKYRNASTRQRWREKKS